MDKKTSIDRPLHTTQLKSPEQCRSKLNVTWDLLNGYNIFNYF